MIKRFYILALCILAVVAQASACDCEGKVDSLEESFTKSNTVFLGRLISVKEYKPIGKLKSNWKHYYLFEFQSEVIYKGEKTKTISFISEGTSCGGDFIEGNSYLVFTFLNKQEKKLEYHKCFRLSLPKQFATEEINNLKTKN